MEKLKEIFLDPEGWAYFHLLGTGAFFKKTIQKTSTTTSVLIHHIPSGVTNLTNRPLFVFTGTHKDAESDYIQKNILSIPFSISLELGEIGLDIMGQEYVELLMELHDNRRGSFKDLISDL